MADDKTMDIEVGAKEIQDMLDYSAEFYKYLRNPTGDTSWYETSIQHQNLVDLNNATFVPERDELRRAIANHTHSEQYLQESSQFMTVWDEIYGKIIDYYVGLLAFNWYPYCTNAYSEQDYTSLEYQDDKQRVYGFFNNFDYKRNFRTALKNMLISDTYFCWLRSSSGSITNEEELKIFKTNQYSLQMMPQSFCKITGTSNIGFVWDFDLNYFNNANTTIENYDPSIIKLYNDNKLKHNLDSYIVNAKQKKSERVGYDHWARVSPNDGGWVFKFNDHTYNTLPPLSGLLKAAYGNDYIEKLQKDKDFMSAMSFIIGEMKTRSQDTAANQKNPYVIKAKDLVSFMNLIKNTMPKEFKPLAFPTENNKLLHFQDNNPHMGDNKLMGTAAKGVSASRMIYSTTDMSKDEVQNALARDYHFVAKVYQQFNAFLEFFINKKTKKYKFKIVTNGSNIPFMQETERETQLKISQVGIQVSLDRWANIMNVEPQALQAMSQEMKSKDYDKLFLLLNSNTTASDTVANSSHGDNGQGIKSNSGEEI